MKLTFKPTEKYKGERTGLVVMGLDYAGLILENTDKGLVLSQVSCPKADKGTSETVNGTVDLKDNTIYLRAKFTSDGKKDFQERRRTRPVGNVPTSVTASTERNSSHWANRSK